MKKRIIISLITALSCTNIAFSGAMGDSNFCANGFVAVEGGYTWSEIADYNFTFNGLALTGISSRKKNNGATGRLAAGVLSMMDDEIGVTGELGWGYYGDVTLNPRNESVILPIPVALSYKYALNGFDALIGVAYIQPYYSASLKIGAMVQNMLITSSDDLAVFDNISTMVNKTNSTAVLPEIKLGAAYNINTNWAITGAYSFVYGANMKTTGIIIWLMIP